jgi:lipopolysaccharide heptosyltransferase II
MIAETMKVKKILFITLSNIGDVILTLPVFDYLKQKYPDADFNVLVAPRPKEIFVNNPAVKKIVVYDKHASWKEKIRLLGQLRKERFNIVVDLRNGLWSVLLSAPIKTSCFLRIPSNIQHMKQRHLYRLTKVIQGYPGLNGVARKGLYISPSDQDYINDILLNEGIKKEDKIIAISSGARSHTKRWAQDKFVELIVCLIEEFKVKIVLVGDKPDIAVNKYIASRCLDKVIDLTSQTTLAQLGALLRKTELLITNDSANLHLASYLGRPVAAIFGPTDEKKYGPWSQDCAIAKKDIFCRPCQKAQCRYNTLECMARIKVEDVLSQARKILCPRAPSTSNSKSNDFKRILIVRTDRIGDVLLSTPAIKALRERYPHAFIAMMVSPYAKDIVEGNPNLDEVIIFDKDRAHKGWINSIKFSSALKKRHFDLTLILHPTNRAHIITFLAGISKRVGYDKKLGFLLTDTIKHTKQLGQKHEMEYALDLVRYLGIEPADKSTFMPIKIDSQEWLKNLLLEEKINQDDKLLAIHPGASCASKLWPVENFAYIADALIEEKGFKVFIVCSLKDKKMAENVIKHMRNSAINLAGKTSVSQLASLLKRCNLFISNDSGPVHIASSVGTPVISIFGRNQQGLSPKRWGPLGKNSQILHHKIGCVKCLAHNCVKGFACIKAVTPEEVLQAAEAV